MPSIGQKLRALRLQQGQEIGEIARATCISSRYLQAIEDDDPKPLPGHFFYKSFIRQYATALGMSEAEIEAELLRLGPDPDAVEQVLPALSENYQPVAIGSMEPRQPKFVLVLGLLLVVSLGCGGLYAWWQKYQAGAPTVEVAQNLPAPTTVNAHGQPQTEPGAVQAVTAQRAADPAPVGAAAVQTAAAGASEATVIVGDGRVSLSLSATEKTWVQVSADGKQLFTGVLDAHESKRLVGVENARILVGNAAGLDVQWNGKPIGPVGPRGQVRVVVFTPETYQILATNKL